MVSEGALSMGKKILVTGAAGFIGMHTALALKERGDFVLGLDNFNSYYDVSLKRKRAEQLQERGISIAAGDITNLELMLQLVDQHQITHVVHLAAQAGVRYSLSCPEAYIESNILGFLKVLELCRARSLYLTYASSSSVYGLNREIPFSIEERTDRQASLYGVTKKSNELMAATYHHLYGLPVTGLRFFTVYGPWGRPDMAYFSFTEAICAGRPIDLYNFGQMRRDFTYIDDIVSGIIASVDYEGALEIFNLGNSQPEPLSQLVAILEEELGKKAVQNLLPMQPGDVLETYADLKESQLKLGYAPKTCLRAGLQSFVAWYKKEYRV
ncbi:MAG: wcaG [Chlamydiales bacterium]|jgi:UDP-glucuronate 4-epimerase|nr:wcaG [Chlamydiales bacterium]